MRSFIRLHVFSGGEFIGLTFFDPYCNIFLNSNGGLTISSSQDRFLLLDYEWGGPAYKTVSNGYTFGGVKTRATWTNKLKTTGHTFSYGTTRDKEIKGRCKLWLKNLATGQEFCIGADCDSDIEVMLANFQHASQTFSTAASVASVAPTPSAELPVEPAAPTPPVEAPADPEIPAPPVVQSTAAEPMAPVTARATPVMAADKPKPKRPRNWPVTIATVFVALLFVLLLLAGAITGAIDIVRLAIIWCVIFGVSWLVQWGIRSIRKLLNK